MNNNKSGKGYRSIWSKIAFQTPFEIGTVLFPFVGEEWDRIK